MPTRIEEKERKLTIIQENNCVDLNKDPRGKMRKNNTNQRAT
jgi:hypothetical protein